MIYFLFSHYFQQFYYNGVWSNFYFTDRIQTDSKTNQNHCLQSGIRKKSIQFINYFFLYTKISYMYINTYINTYMYINLSYTYFPKYK